MVRGGEVPSMQNGAYHIGQGGDDFAQCRQGLVDVGSFLQADTLSARRLSSEGGREKKFQKCSTFPKKFLENGCISILTVRCQPDRPKRAC
jgi:hypothetical protein